MTRKPKPKGPTLAEYTERYLLARDTSEQYARYVRACCRKFCEWCKEPVYIADLDCQIVNEWLAAFRHPAWRRTDPRLSSGHPGCLVRSVHEQRQRLSAVALRRIKKPRLTVVAYSHTEIRKLLNAAATLTTYFPNGVRL